MSTLRTAHSGASSRGSGFPGFGEGAPLDLSDLTDTAAAGIASRLRERTLDAFTDTAAAVGYCARPIRLTGHSTTVDASTGEVLDTFSSDQAPLGVLYRPCGNRRAEVCPSCSRTYARDTFEMIRAGVAGGKTVPTSVACNPLLFVTLTAPSFGLVHGTRPDNRRCRPRSRDRVEACPHGTRLACSRRHTDDDPTVGAPLCWACYDFHTAVIWQWHAPELWRRTTITLRRALATRLGVPASKLKKVAGLQYAKVAEYQARGVVHFHALIRLDGPDGPGTPAPLDANDLADVVQEAVRKVTHTAPPAWETDVARVLAWGRQVDVRAVVHGHQELHETETLSGEQVAGYLAKYATKDASSIRSTDQARPHLQRLAATCRDLHALAITREQQRRSGEAPSTPLDLKTGRDHYALLGKWAHALGFRGHFSTKSRAYSITLGRLRRARAKYQAFVVAARHDDKARAALLDTRELEARLLADDEDTTLVIGSWSYAGTGWTNPGDEALALAAAARAREYAQWRAQQHKA